MDLNQTDICGICNEDITGGVRVRKNHKVHESCADVFDNQKEDEAEDERVFAI